MFVGYLVLTATILDWVLVSHHSDLNTAAATRGLLVLGIPIVAWLFAVAPPSTSPEEPA